MKKQSNTLSAAANSPLVRKMELIFLVLIATLFYRNISSRRLPSTMPPNAMGLLKQAVQGIISEAEKLSSKLAVFFYNVTGASMVSLLQFVGIAALVSFTIAGIIYVIKTH